MSDLTKRLREITRIEKLTSPQQWDVDEAADLIERLAAKVAQVEVERDAMRVCLDAPYNEDKRRRFRAEAALAESERKCERLMEALRDAHSELTSVVINTDRRFKVAEKVRAAIGEGK